MSRPIVYIALQQFCQDDERPRQLLREAGVEIRQNTLGRRIRREEMPQALADAEAVLAGVEPYDAALLDGLPRLRVISRCGVGTDAIDLAAAAHRRIAVLTTVEEVVEPVAQMTVAMLFALARQFPRHLSDFHAGQWKKHTGVLLSEWTIGLIGFGRIARVVERYLRPFGPRVVVADPRLQAEMLPQGVALKALPSVLAEADVISLHAARDPADGALIGRAELASMKPGAFLVNTARGFLVDHEALAEALSSGHLAGAALDVFDSEPYTGPLSRIPQVLCTPHVSTLTKASRAAMEWRCAKNLVDWLAQHGQVGWRSLQRVIA